MAINRREFLKISAAAVGRLLDSADTANNQNNRVLFPAVFNKENLPPMPSVEDLNAKTLEYLQQFDLPALPIISTNSVVEKIPQWRSVYDGEIKTLEHLANTWILFKQENKIPENIIPFRTDVQEYRTTFYSPEPNVPSSAYTQEGTSSSGNYLVMVTYYGTGTDEDRYSQAANESFHRYFKPIAEHEPEQEVIEEAGSEVTTAYLLETSEDGDPETAMSIPAEYIAENRRLIDTGWNTAIAPTSDKRFFLQYLERLMKDTHEGQFLHLREHFGSLIASEAVQQAEQDGDFDKLLASLISYSISRQDESFLIKPSDSYFKQAIDTLRDEGHLLNSGELPASYELKQIAYIVGSNLQVEHDGYIGPRLFILNAYRNEGEVKLVPHPEEGGSLTNIEFYFPEQDNPIATEIQYRSDISNAGHIRFFTLNMPRWHFPDGSRIEFDTYASYVDESTEKIVESTKHQVVYINATRDQQQY